MSFHSASLTFFSWPRRALWGFERKTTKVPSSSYRVQGSRLPRDVSLLMLTLIAG